MKDGKRVDLECSQHKKEMVVCDLMEVLANAMEIIILQHISNQHVVHFELTQCICQLYLNKAGKCIYRAKIITINEKIHNEQNIKILNQDSVSITDFSLTPAFLNSSMAIIDLYYLHNNIFGLDVALIFRC